MTLMVKVIQGQGHSYIVQHAHLKLPICNKDISVLLKFNNLTLTFKIYK